MNRDIVQVAIHICLPKIWSKYKLRLNQKEERDNNTDESSSSHSSDDIAAIPPYNHDFLSGYLTALIDCPPLILGYNDKIGGGCWCPLSSCMRGWLEFKKNQVDE